MRPEQKPVKTVGNNDARILIARNPDGAAEKHYNLHKIRALLTEGFSGDELRRFVYDEIAFRPVYYEISEETGKADLIDELIEYADQKVLLDTVLHWAKETNEAQYNKHKPYYDQRPPARDQAILPGPESRAEEKQAFYLNPVFYTVGGFMLLAAIVLAFWLRPPFFPGRLTPTPAATDSPGIGGATPFPPPVILVEKLKEDINNTASDPLQPRRGDYISVPPRVHTVGRTEFVYRAHRHLWLFICKRVPGEILCQAQELKVTASGRWDDFVFIGRSGPEDDCSVFEVSFVVLQEQTHEQFNQIAAGPVAEANLPGGEERVRYEVRRELDSDDFLIECVAMASATSASDTILK